MVESERRLETIVDIEFFLGLSGKASFAKGHPLFAGSSGWAKYRAGQRLDADDAWELSRLAVWGATLRSLEETWSYKRDLLQAHLRDSHRCASVLYELDVYEFLRSELGVPAGAIKWTAFEDASPDFVVNGDIAVECKLTRTKVEADRIHGTMRDVNRQHAQWAGPVVTFIGTISDGSYDMVEHMVSDSQWLHDHPTISGVIIWQQTRPPKGRQTIVRNHSATRPLPEDTWEYGVRAVTIRRNPLTRVQTVVRQHGHDSEENR